MYKTRAVTQGRVAELFGEKAISIDRFSRTIGFTKIATETWNSLSQEQKDLLTVYTDGVNDFV
jgi:penicillin amidase